MCGVGVLMSVSCGMSEYIWDVYIRRGSWKDWVVQSWPMTRPVLL